MSRRKHSKTGRSSRPLANFLAIERYIMQSSAWRALSVVDRAAYLELGFRYNGANNGRIAISTRQLAEALHISKATASRSLSNLLNKGFIELVKVSSFHYKIRHCPEYRLTAFPCDVTNALPSKAFMRWPHEEKARSHQRSATVARQAPTVNIGTEKQPDSCITGPVDDKNESSTVSP